ncbi:hypothetical protein EMWEY_00059300, partial [Eimeria maxima]
MKDFLRELPELDFVGNSMPPVEHLSKLAQLLTLQQTALTQIQGGMQHLAKRYAEKPGSTPDQPEEDLLAALHRTTDLRRDQVFQDRVVGRWLIEQHKPGSRSGLAGQKVIEPCIACSPNPHEELLKELLNTPLGLRQQMGSGQIPMQPGVRSTLQGQEATIEKSAPPGHVK